MTASTRVVNGARLIDQTPLGKLGNESDLKGSVLLLVSDAGGTSPAKSLSSMAGRA
jgi:hypothetical protein